MRLPGPSFVIMLVTVNIRSLGMTKNCGDALAVHHAQDDRQKGRRDSAARSLPP